MWLYKTELQERRIWQNIESDILKSELLLGRKSVPSLEMLREWLSTCERLDLGLFVHKVEVAILNDL